nr:unnamed protein product [Callosobruchus analis]
MIWAKWKRALGIYLDAANIDNPSKKKATLLHVGGLGIQEIYYNLPGAHVEPTEDNDVYEIALRKLEKYFAPKQSKVYERHIFRLLKQEPTEKFEKYLVRLRNQAEKCKYTNPEENIIDQIVEKCHLTDLRKKILTIGDSITLEGIVMEANALESVSRQMEDFDGRKGSVEVNKILHKNIRNRNAPSTASSSRSCYRCNAKSHLSFNCPDKDSTCQKCGMKGHTSYHCRSKFMKRKPRYHSPPKQSKRTGSKRQHRDESDEDNDVNYIFHIDNDSDIICTIGGVPVQLVIDSGSKCNIINDRTWTHLKNSKAVVFNQIKKPDKMFMAYASNNPLEVLGSFEAHISGIGPTKLATFYVVKHGLKNLLGKETAKSLGVLQLGITNLSQINTVSNFPKFKDIVVTIPIDENVKPVVQPYRRVPIPLENKINKKIEELLDCDINNRSSRWSFTVGIANGASSKAKWGS